MTARSASCVVLIVTIAACSSGSAVHPVAAVKPRTERTTTSTTSRPTTAAPVAPTSAPAVSQPSTPTTTPPAAPGTGSRATLRGHVIVVDAGHNGGNGAHSAEIAQPVFIGTQTRACDATGTQTADGYPEHAYNLDVALRLRDALSRAGATVVMVRTDGAGWGPCINERAAIGNRAQAEAGISIHADGGPTSGHGFHVNVPANIPGYTDDIYAASHTLGVALRDTYAAETGISPSTYIGNGGLVERADFGGLNLSDVPKVLFETANMRNADDAALVDNPTIRQRIADALADGLARYFTAPR